MSEEDFLKRWSRRKREAAEANKPAPPAAATRGYQDQAPPSWRAPVTTTGCRAFTPELRSIVWPSKFKPDLPPHYDGTPDPAEFL